MKQQPLQARIFWRCFALLFILVVGVATTAVFSEIKHYQQTSLAFYSAQARLLSIQISDHVLWNDRVNLTQRLNRTVSSDEAIAYAYITINQQPLVYTFKQGFPDELLQININPQHNISTSVIKDTAGIIYNHIMVDIESSTAVLHLGILHSELNLRAWHNIGVIIFMALLALIIGGGISRYIAVVTTKEVEQAEEKIKVERRFLQTVIDAVMDPIRVINTDHKIMLMNRAAHHEGLNDEKNGRCDSDYCSKRDDNNMCPLELVNCGKAATRFSQQRTLKNGSSAIFEVDTAPLYDHNNLLGIVKVTRDITNRRKLEAQLSENESRLHFLSNHDLLTNLPNRYLLREQLNEILAPTNPDKQATVLIVGLDRFKKINETLGREMGDTILARIARRFDDCLHQNETLVRLGSDEFCVVIASNHEVKSAGRAAKRFLSQFEQPFKINDCELHLSASIGISLYPEDGTSAKELMKNADIALIRAKQEGKGCYQFFEQSMTQDSTNFFKMENDLRNAITEQQFMVNYQPQIDLKTGLISGMEALVRWNHPELGLVGPLEFIPIAEESGLIVPIGLWVLEEACRQIVDWKKRGITSIPVAVNLSAVQFRQKDLIESIKNIIDATGIDPAQLELEITESMIMQNVEEAIQTMHALTQCGIKLAIDDFGTGYSSLSYLRYFPLTKLKIDKSFIDQVTSNDHDAALASSVIALAHSLNLKVVAEGIETRQQATFLRLKDCHQGQGFLFSKPISAAQLELIFHNKY